MGYKAKDQEIASGQVSKDTYNYLKAFAKAKSTSLSAVVGDILAEWKESRRSINPIDAAAHDEADKLIGRSGVMMSGAEAGEGELARRTKSKTPRP